MKTWPPLSVWLVIAALTLPPLMLAVALTTGLLPAKFGIDYIITAGVLAGGLAAAGLVGRGRRAGFWLAVAVGGVYLFGATGWVGILRS